MTTTSAIPRLSDLLEQLRSQAINVDRDNTNHKSHWLIENNNLFSQQLFSCESDKFLPYVEETQRRLIRLSHLISTSKRNHSKEELAKASLMQIEQQISSIMSALQSNNTMHQVAQLSYDAKKQVRAKIQKNRHVEKFKKMAKNVMFTSHQLYEKLNENREFERRLMLMVSERDLQRAQCRPSEAVKISNEVLALHQRLGRCRQAISRIEHDIELAEKTSK